MLRADIRGLSIAYERAGSGPPLVLLHGFALDSRSWWPQLESLTDDFTVLAWDAPGAGKSSDPHEEFGTSDWADCLAGLLDAAGVAQAHVVGLSWGGIVAQEFSRRNADRIRSLVLADTYAGWKGSLDAEAADERLDLCMRYSTLRPDEFVGWLIPGMFTDSIDVRVKQRLAGIMADFHPMGFRLMSHSTYADRSALLGELGAPTLLVWGDQDARSPVAVAHQFHRAIPGSKLTVITQAGHLSNLEQPRAFDAAVAEFCSAY